MPSFCELIPTMPQNIVLCWFNSILMAMIYSDGLSRYIYEKAFEENWQDDENGAFKTLMLLFMNYVRAIKYGKIEYIEKLREFLKKYKTEILLLDFLNHYHPELIEKYYNIIKQGFFAVYLPYILDKLGLNCSLILLSNGKFYNGVKFNYIDKKYIAYDYNSINTTPDILLFDIFNISNFDEFKYPVITETDLKKLGGKIIEFYGVEYKLDCILLRDKDNKHTITGLTCNGSKYIYNGWWKQRNDKNPCNLMPFDWTTDTTDFCLNEMECSLPKDLSKGNYCFNFKNNYRLMVYVRIKDKVELEIKQVRNIKHISSHSHFDKYNKMDIIDILKNIFNIKYDLYIYNLEQLKTILNKHYSEKSIESLKDLSSINFESELKPLTKLKLLDKNKYIYLNRLKDNTSDNNLKPLEDLKRFEVIDDNDYFLNENGEIYIEHFTKNRLKYSNAILINGNLYDKSSLNKWINRNHMTNDPLENKRISDSDLLKIRSINIDEFQF